MRSVFKNIIYRSLILLFAVQTLNLSISSIDFQNTSSKVTADVDDLDYVDSMVEFLVENVIGFSKHTFDDRAYNNDIARLQQNIVHWDWKWSRYSIIISNLKETQRPNITIIPSNEKALSLYYQEVRPKPPRFLFV
jgi:hypothetical protein